MTTSPENRPAGATRDGVTTLDDPGRRHADRVPASVRRVVTLVFYGGLGLLQVLIFLALLKKMLPGGVAQSIGNNSEGYVFALLVGAWIQFVRPRLRGTRWQWAVTAAAAVACLVIGVILFRSEFPSRFKTLNETFFALSLVLPLVQPRRPLPAPLGAGLSVAALVVMVIGSRTEFGTDLAETWGLLLLAPLGFLVIDRGVLDSRARTVAGLRYAWYAVLVAAPITLHLIQYTFGAEGMLDSATRYGVRFHEAFVGMLLLEVFLAVGLGRTGRPRSGAPGGGEAQGVTGRK